MRGRDSGSISEIGKNRKRPEAVGISGAGSENRTRTSVRKPDFELDVSLPQQYSTELDSTSWWGPVRSSTDAYRLDYQEAARKDARKARPASLPAARF